MDNARIKPIDQTSVHRITSSQVVVDLQTAVKELVENALDAGATVVDVRIKENGVKSVEVIDNGSGIAKDDYDTVALKHHTSKLSTFEDLTTVETFGFRGEALASLCALCESVVITTATSSEAPMGTVLELDRSGRVLNKERRVARQRGTTVSLTGLFVPLPVRRKEFERHAKREYGKALTLLTAYALVPSTAEGGGVKLTVSHISEAGKKSVQIQTDGTPNLKNSITALWGSKAMENVVHLDLDIKVEPDSATLKRRGLAERQMTVKMSGLVSKFAVGCGRSSGDRQFFFVNKRPCNLTKVQKAINEIYKTFNATQSPFIVVDFALPTDACDINVSPDKRTIFLHSEHNLIEAMKIALANHFDDSRSMFTIQPSIVTLTSASIPSRQSRRIAATEPISSSLDKPISIPSSDPLPSTQPDTLIITSSDSTDGPLDDRLATPDVETTGHSDPDPSSSKLGDHMSPAPLVEMELPDDEPVVIPTIPRKRPASRSPHRSSIPRAVAPRSKKSVQMVLNTTGASWSLSKENGGVTTRPLRKPSAEVGGATWQANGRKPASGIRNTLTQFRRGGDAVVESEEEDGGEAVPQDEDAQEEKSRRREATHDRPVPERRSRATSRSSRSSMRIDSPPDSPDSVPEILMEDTPMEAAAPSEAPEIPSTARRPPTSARLPRTIPRVERPSIPERIEIPSPGGDGIANLASSPTQERSTQAEAKPDEIMKDEVIVMSVAFDMDNVNTRWKRASQTTKLGGATGSSASKESPAVTTLANTVEIGQAEDDKAEALLARVIKKEDFEKMEILGQFNLGFIIVRSRRSTGRGSNGRTMRNDRDDHSAQDEEMDDLFIVDQHAADEKYNFETLQLTTRIESQKLIRARPLDLSASDKLMALENLEVLQSNGFEVELDAGGAGGEGDAESRGGQLLLVSQPVSKQTTFDMSDLAELLHLMQDKPAGTMVRCSRARAMFASRACRKSVMVGHPLTKAQMTSVVRHMSTMDQPWNCPHGRPTMRHLMRMTARRPADAKFRKVDWEKIG